MNEGKERDDVRMENTERGGDSEEGAEVNKSQC